MNNQELHGQMVSIGQIIDADATQKKQGIKMVFHFSRVVDADIQVEAETFGECVERAIQERIKACTPTKINGEVVE